MGLFRLIEKRAGYSSSAGDWARDVESGVGLRTWAGRKVGKKDALGLSAVFFCVGLIADSISTLPIDIIRTMNGKREKLPTPGWLDQPNPYETRQDFYHKVLVSMAMDGNAYIATIRNDYGAITSLYCLDPRTVEVRWKDPNKMTEVVFDVMGEIFDASQVLQIPLFTIAGEPKGMSPLEAARQAIGLGLTAEEFGARFFGQGANMAGVIEAPKPMDEDEATRLQKMFSKKHAGTKNSHAIGVLTGGAIWKSISITPEQSQFLETRAFTKVDVGLFYRVPAYMLDPHVTSTWGTGIEEQNWAFVQNTLSPWITRIEQRISTFLLPRGQELKFNLDARLRPKTSERYKTYQTGILTGFLNADTVREWEDLPPIPKGQGKIYWHPSASQEVGKEPQAPAPIPDQSQNQPDNTSGNNNGDNANA